MNRSVYNNFYKTTVGRFYTKEQKLRLLRLYVLTAGIAEDSEEYNNIFRCVTALDRQGITSYTESKNYSMISGIFAEDTEMNAAVDALVAAHKCILDNRNNPTFDGKVSWIIALRKTPQENPDMRFELALFEYACGNTDAAVKELKELVNTGLLYAMEILACIHVDNQDFEEAFYYYSLIRKVYLQELKLLSPLATNERIDVFREKISVQKADEITQNIDSSMCFFDCNTSPNKTIGFVGEKARKFTYEY